MEKIFIVEDCKITSNLLERILKRNNYRIAGKERFGEKAFQSIQQSNPDAVLMDIQLAGKKSGIDVFNELKKNKSSIPVIFTSGQVEYAEQFEIFIGKPYSDTEILKGLEQVFKS